MNLPFISDETFKSLNYTVDHLPLAEYEYCTFINCDFSESCISKISFLECEFMDCNFSMVKAKETCLRDVIFKNCKLVGFPFHDCNMFLLSMTFIKSQLNLSSFYDLQLKNTTFEDCKLEQTDFTNTNLSASTFDNCNLDQTIFDNTVLEKVDFSTSYNLSINPNSNRIKDANFSKENALGLLGVFQITID